MNYDNPFLELNISRDRQIATNNAETQTEETQQSVFATQTEIFINNHQENLGIQTIPLPFFTPFKQIKYIPKNISPIKSKKPVNLTKSLDFTSRNIIPKKLKFNFLQKVVTKNSNRNSKQEAHGLSCKTQEKANNEISKTKLTVSQIKDQN